MKLHPYKLALAAVTAVTLATTVAGATAGTAAPGLLPAQWVGAWSASPAVPGAAAPAFAGLTDQSVRMVVRSSISGEGVRIRVSDAFGDRHLGLGHATVALPDTATADRTDVIASSVKNLTFSGSQSVTIPKGSNVVSDPVSLKVPALAELVVTLYFPAATGPATFHGTAVSQSYIGAGDLTTAQNGTGFTITRTNFYFLTEVEVQTRKSIGSVVVIGDSIADGFASTLNANKRWPDQLADRLIAQRPFGPIEVGVLNGGLAGNQIGHDGTEIGAPGTGVNGLARLDRDAFGMSGVRVVFVCLGVNDMGFSNDVAANIITYLKQAALQIKAQGLIAVGCTISPFEGFSYWTPAKELDRAAINAYLRGPNDFHKVIDFDAVLRDPAAPSHLKPELDSGDHIHPNDAGYGAMANAIPLGFIN